MKVSAVIITLNEEDRIKACLESVSFCDEIVVVDAGSSDRTVEIAKRFTDRVIHHKWESYGAQKSYAINLATRPWVLLVDADERVTLELKDEIVALPDDVPEDGFLLKRDFYFMGRLMRHGGEGGDYILRLFRKEKSSVQNERIHESVRVPGRTGILRGSLTHYSYRNLSDYFQRFDKYSTLSAIERYEQGARPGFFQNLRIPFEFIWRYIIRLGFLDGYPGFVYATLSSFYAWAKYAKLREITESRSKKN